MEKAKQGIGEVLLKSPWQPAIPCHVVMITFLLFHAFFSEDLAASDMASKSSEGPRSRSPPPWRTDERPGERAGNVKIPRPPGTPPPAELIVEAALKQSQAWLDRACTAEDQQGEETFEIEEDDAADP